MIAIAFKSESGDDYLKLSQFGETMAGFIERLKKDFDDEWEYLHLVNIASNILSTKSLIEDYNNLK